MDLFKKYILEDLKRNGIDIYSSDYKNSPNYKNRKDSWVSGGNDGWMTLEEYIERYILDKNEVLDTYESKYDMGNPYELDYDECQYIALSEEIINNMNLLDKEGVILEAESFSKRFFKKKGIIDRLKTQLSFDIELFDENNLKHKAEICKIIYFVYLSENKYIPEMLGRDRKYFNMLDFIDNPSMESIDNSFLGMETSNGIIVKFIKASLEKELTLSAKNDIKAVVSSIVSEWDNIIGNAYILMDFLHENGYDYDFKETISLLASEPEKISVPASITRYAHSPIETFYLKVVQHEYLGNTIDISKINDIHMTSDYNVSPDLIDEMKKLHYSSIDINDPKKYIEENPEKILKFVFWGSEKTSKKMEYHKEKLNDKMRRWLEFCGRTKPLLDLKEIANELQMISFLQAVLLDDPKETFDYIFYGYQEHMKHKPQVQGALKNDEYTIDALKSYWTRKVTDRWYANIGRNDVRCKVKKLEKICDHILEEILNQPNLDKMIEMHIYYATNVDDELITTVEQIQAVQKFEQYLHNKGFKYIDDHYKIRYAFLCPVEIAETYANLTFQIEDTLKDNDALLHVTFKASTANAEKQTELDFKLFFDYQNKKCIMLDFKRRILYIENDEYKK